MQPIRIPELDAETKAKIVQNGKKGFSEATPVGARDEAAAEQAHKLSRFMLKEQRSPWPSVEEMKRLAHSESTILNIKYRIAELKKEHRQQLAKAIKYQEHEYAQMMVDESSAFDTMTDWNTDVMEEVKSYLRMEHHIRTHQSDDFIWNLRYSHIKALKPLYETLYQLILSEDHAKQQRARRFPKTSQAWREMDTRDAKLKVAKFLLMDRKRQDEMILRETDWRADKADIEKTILEFQRNIMFFEEVKNFVKEHQTTDPRRRG